MTTAGLVKQLVLGLFAVTLLSSIDPASAQRKSDADYEEFEEVCPYTNGDPDLEKALGYTRVGTLPWRGSDDSEAVRVNMGAIPMIFVETEHFRIGSSLITYKIPNDKEERARLDGELDRLEAKLGRLKAPKKELDPWLRLHLYAQRIEDLYSNFEQDWGIELADYSRRGPNLGYRNKYLVVLCERKSEFGRYLRTYEQKDLEYAYRSGWFGEGLITCVNMEAITENWKDEKEMPFDSMLTCMLTASMAANFVDGWNNNMFRAPAWVTYGYTHIAQRRFDRRWVVFDGRTTIYGKEDDKTDWPPRVLNLIKNNFFASADEMFGWEKFEDMNQRDHMIAWSKLEYLLTEVEGDREAFLTAVCPAATGMKAAEVDVRKARQAKALADSFGMTPEQLDERWSEWTKKAYRRR